MALTSPSPLFFIFPFSFPPLPAASIPVVGFNAVYMSEHFGAFLAFVVLHLAMLVRYVRSSLSPAHFR